MKIFTSKKRIFYSIILICSILLTIIVFMLIQYMMPKMLTYSEIQSYGGIRVGTVYQSGGIYYLPIDFDISGLSHITTTPTNVNSSYGCKAVMKEWDVPSNTITLGIQPVLGGQSKCKDLPIGKLPDGVYRVNYLSGEPIGEIGVTSEIVAHRRHKLESINQPNADSIIPDGDDINKAVVNLKNGDNTISLTAHINKNHRIFGYAQPDITSEKLLLLSVFTDDVDGNPFGYPLGAYYDTTDIMTFHLRYIATVGDFIQAEAIYPINNTTIPIYFEKKWIELIR